MIALHVFISFMTAAENMM